ncbi:MULTISPECIES: energy-coupling factor ABC transporter permease [Prosthecochloris]|uniref:Cobalamin biosynthesis protein CbiM n=1 Tax=Prosthecochloris vibrioformis TaxID=1098 RepID=A0A5C4RT39_PROVB|nr:MULTISPECIES: energy-coupling factor ABC transporter permease [Prosthecochloris]ANT64714.1 Energy-coupling factor transporter probable substrate-capture protein NikMN [Prosthecochloris sp. CIB 2401]TNJ34149.1 cobalamin biosynthesis protein CbiM [Prosthecochloris vibrioformis]
MHIPDSMLQGSVCPATATVSAIGIAAAAYYGMNGEKPSASRFAAITALIFAGQMMNFSIMNGTSGHLLGGVLAASLLGTPFGVLSVAMVVVIQSLVFSDGGVTVLGANLLNMAIIGAGLGGMLRSTLAARWQSPRGEILATAVAAWASVVLASFTVSVELAIDGQIVFSSVVAAMVATHALIGIGEAIITVAACLFVHSTGTVKIQRGHVVVPFTAATVIALLLSPFASGFPDGLEWVAEKYQFLHESAPAFVGPLPDYSVSFIGNEMLSTGLSGMIGVIISFAAAWALHRFISLFVAQQQIA